jgi:hypothetical protein
MFTAINNDDLLGVFVVQNGHFVLEIKINSELIGQFNLPQSTCLFSYLFSLHVSK